MWDTTKVYDTHNSSTARTNPRPYGSRYPHSCKASETPQVTGVPACHVHIELLLARSVHKVLSQQGRSVERLDRGPRTLFWVLACGNITYRSPWTGIPCKSTEVDAFQPSVAVEFAPACPPRARMSKDQTLLMPNARSSSNHGNGSSSFSQSLNRSTRSPSVKGSPPPRIVDLHGPDGATPSPSGSGTDGLVAPIHACALLALSVSPRKDDVPPRGQPLEYIDTQQPTATDHHMP